MSEELFKVNGLATHMQKLDRLPLQVGYKALRDAGKYAMKPLVRVMAHNAREDTGDLKLSFGMSAKKGRKGISVVTISVGPIKKKASGRTLKNIQQKAIAQEYGNERVDADPNIRRTMDENTGMVLARLRGRLGKNIEDAFK